MNSKIKLAIASLVGGCCVYVALTACGGGSSGVGIPTADAQVPACSKYQVVAVDTFDLTPTGQQVAGRDVREVPGGWEPYSVRTDVWDGLVGLRRCVP